MEENEWHNGNLLVGDVLEKIKEIPDSSVDCCISSPPYWGLRDYGTGEWTGGNGICDHSSIRRKTRKERGGLTELQAGNEGGFMHQMHVVQAPDKYGHLVHAVSLPALAFTAAAPDAPDKFTYVLSVSPEERYRNFSGSSGDLVQRRRKPRASERRHVVRALVRASARAPGVPTKPGPKTLRSQGQTCREKRRPARPALTSIGWHKRVAFPKVTVTIPE